MGEYHDLYLKSDVILLTNVFEAFRETCLEHYNLDPAHFFTSPGLAWKACLKKTGISLELLTNPDMLLMFERGIRGGITQAVHRYARANNKYMGENFNPKEDSRFLQYLDANNLYSWAMSQHLPTGGFRWVNVDPNEIGELAKRDGIGYLLEIDVSYPQELHDSHNNLSFMCEKMKINGVEKLVPNLFNKKNYVIHIQMLDQALKHGVILEKIHRTVEFIQTAWMKPYIDFNTQLRTQSKNDFKKDLFKLMNNAVFGKTMKNIRKHRNIKLVTNTELYLKTIMKPNFKSGTLFGENLMGCERGKIKVMMNKPVYLGQAILDLSKIVMYEFHYDYMLLKYARGVGTAYEDNLKLCYMDTDSLVYHIKTEDFFADIADDVPTRFNTFGYCTRPLPIGKNKEVIGLMKDELGGAIMTEFIALRPKLYSFRKLDGAEDNKCKGIKKCVVKRTLFFYDYKNCLLNPTNESVYRPQLMFRSKKHKVHTTEVNKVALDRNDDKQIAKKDGISILAHDHKSLCWSPLLGEIFL